jgi:hypothetical protein
VGQHHTARLSAICNRPPNFSIILGAWETPRNGVPRNEVRVQRVWPADGFLTEEETKSSPAEARRSNREALLFIPHFSRARKYVAGAIPRRLGELKLTSGQST